MRRTTRLGVATLIATVMLLSVRPFALPQDGGRGQNLPDRAAAASAARYIVQLAELPLVSYEGGVPGFGRTRRQAGEKVDPTTPEVLAYGAFLNGRHDQLLATVGGGRKLYDYQFVFNGFAAELSADQAAALRGMPGVVSVVRDELHYGDTATTPAFLGLNAQGGLWDQLGGPDRAGDGIIIGVIDSGIWPESPSFSDRTGNGSKGGRLDYHPIPGWHGTCQKGERFKTSDCNQKLIGARYYNAALGGDAGVDADWPWEFNSPRDYAGHGTHTASTAGGNANVRTTGPTALFGHINGMAPHARIAVYKALWSLEDGSEALGATSDLVAAIDQAVADGVDVINYSVSGTQTNFLDPAEIAFLNATAAGVFVAASAGNSGPTASTVAHPSPWVTTVAAGTHNRDGRGSVTLGNGATFTGASLAPRVGPAPFIDAETAGRPGANPTAARLCFAAGDNNGVPVLDPAKVAGKIVLCDRGTNARAAKSIAVLEAGGVGMVLVNTSPNSLNADFHYVPTVHLADTDRAAVKAYAAVTGATATINKATLLFDVPAPTIAGFSSRGPLRAGGGDLLKPDLIAPGQAIVAAVAPPGNNGLEFSQYDGTSMAAPHVAGVAALLKHAHPDWTPMMIKSALMTSAGDVIDDANTSPAVIFGQGAGHIAPNRATSPGLVYDSDQNDWFAFLCGTTTGISPLVCSALDKAGYSLDPSDMNIASIAVGDLIASQTVRRRVTNVSRSRATYTATVTGMAGIDVTVTPSVLTLKSGETKSFTVRFQVTSAAFNTYVGGQLHWSDGIHDVRSPMVARPLPLSVASQVSGTGGPISYNVKFGFSGPFTASPRGLLPAAVTSGTITEDPDRTFTPDPNAPGTVAIPITILPGRTYARFSLFDADVSPASDLDLYLVKGASVVGISATGTSNEEINLVNPAAGSDYVLYVHGFSVPGGGAAFKAFWWLIDSTASGNMTVTAPPTATPGATGTIRLTFSGLAPATRYLGSIAYSASTTLPAPTIVRVDTP